MANHLTQSSVICSLCRAADGHQWVNQWSGQSWHPLPGLSHLCNEGSLPWHWWSPSAQRAGGEEPWKQGCATWIWFQPFFRRLDLKTLGAILLTTVNWFWLAGKCCQTAAQQSSVSKCQSTHCGLRSVYLTVSTEAEEFVSRLAFAASLPSFDSAFYITNFSKISTLRPFVMLVLYTSRLLRTTFHLKLKTTWS